MQGYSLMVEEALAQAPTPPSHVFVQGGVGGLAAGVCSYLWERYGADRPRFVVVEPDKADCLYRSAVAGRPTPAEGALDTIMAGLACGEVSILAWRILEQGADAFITIGDDAAADCMRAPRRRRLRRRSGGGRGIRRRRARRPAAGKRRCRCARRLDLRPDSTVLVFGTEGATDAEVYRIDRRPLARRGRRAREA